MSKLAHRGGFLSFVGNGYLRKRSGLRLLLSIVALLSVMEEDGVAAVAEEGDDGRKLGLEVVNKQALTHSKRSQHIPLGSS